MNKPHHEHIDDPLFRRAVDLLDAGDHEGLHRHLQEHPKLALQHVNFAFGNYFKSPTLLEFIAENPIRHGTLPDNIAAMARVILDAGADQSAVTETLGLVATGRVAQECGAQIPLIDLLCDHGADLQGALLAAASHGEYDAVKALLRRGAQLNLPVAAALGHIEDFRRLLPTADANDRQLALAMASKFGHNEMVKSLLDAGEDPNRYNPAGSDAHSTPLHQAAWAGHENVVSLLLERGARLNIKDKFWQGTPADWAGHAGRAELEAYLRSHQE